MSCLNRSVAPQVHLWVVGDILERSGARLKDPLVRHTDRCSSVPVIARTGTAITGDTLQRSVSLLVAGLECGLAERLPLVEVRGRVGLGLELDDPVQRLLSLVDLRLEIRGQLRVAGR